jgi:hypothetical protein
MKKLNSRTCSLIEEIVYFFGVTLFILILNCEITFAQNRHQINNREFEASNLWYEGALLGNGDVGVVAFGADDRITFAVGKNDFWDRRYYFHLFKPLTFRRYMEMVKNEWSADSVTGWVIPPGDIFETYEPELLLRNKRAKPLSKWHKPTPKPVCRISIWQPDAKTESGRRDLKRIKHIQSLENAELTTHTSAFYTVSRVQKKTNLVFINLEGLSEKTVISLKRNFDATETGIEPAVHTVKNGFGIVTQDMPPERTYPKGFKCVVVAILLNGAAPELHGQEIRWTVKENCTLVIAVATTRDNPQPETAARKLIHQMSKIGDAKLRQEHVAEWKKFWDASWIKIDDEEVERMWYFCNYMLASATRPGAIAPGLFGPWIVEDRSAWGGSYTTDYNFQQTFAAALSCNHPELLEPYLSTLENMLPAAREFARDIYEADGIAFPHEIYPINMHGQMRATDTYIVETPYLVQHFWEYYDYMQDEDFLRLRAYPIIAECADFLASYATNEGDGNYVFYPTRSCEHHGLMPGLPFNRNGTPELGFARYIFKAALKGASLVGEKGERQFKWQEVLDGLPAYAKMCNQLGEVYLDCEVTNEELNVAPPVQFTLDSRPSKTHGNHGAWMFYNVPTSLLHVWPAGQVDMDSPADELLTAMRTWMTLKLEGSNDLVLRHVAAARLGIPTLEKFKQDVADRLMLNGAVTIKVNPIKKDISYNKGYFEYWANGIYTENCGLPVVINEMMLQSHNDVLKLFPTMDFYRSAEFHNLRAHGGFIVSAEMEFGFVKWAEIKATVNRLCRVRLPWTLKVLSIINVTSGENVTVKKEGRDVTFATKKGETYRITPIILNQRSLEK